MERGRRLLCWRGGCRCRFVALAPRCGVGLIAFATVALTMTGLACASNVVVVEWSWRREGGVRPHGRLCSWRHSSPSPTENGSERGAYPSPPASSCKNDTVSPSPLLQLWHVLGGARLMSLNFTGMGGPMGVYDGYDTDRCQAGGTQCSSMDNEANYGSGGGSVTSILGMSGGPHGEKPALWLCALSHPCIDTIPCTWHGAVSRYYHFNRKLSIEVTRYGTWLSIHLSDTVPGFLSHPF
jgi:hypothetical protein